MLLSPAAIGTVSEVLHADDFYFAKHGHIYQAALGLYAKGEPVDAITLVNELEERGELAEVGGRVRIHELAALVPATANAGHYARIVREMAMLRAQIRAGGEIARRASERAGSAEELQEQAEGAVFDLARQRANGGLEQIDVALREHFEALAALQESGGGLVGTPSGLPSLDRLTNGFRPGNLIVLAARPSMGKSALALQITGWLAFERKLPVAFYSLEMSRSELAHRYYVFGSGIPSERLESGRLDEAQWRRVIEAGGRYAGAPYHFHDKGSVSLLTIRSEAMRLKLRHPELALVVVDYLQLMVGAGEAENRTAEVSAISRSLKLLARDLDVPVLALSQLNRNLEQRTDKRPLLSDLRESGSIEQDADLVLFIYRDAYYNKDSEARNVAELILAKHRNGPTDTVRLAFIKELAKFSELAPAAVTAGVERRAA